MGPAGGSGIAAVLLNPQQPPKWHLFQGVPTSVLFLRCRAGFPGLFPLLFPLPPLAESSGVKLPGR